MELQRMLMVGENIFRTTSRNISARRMVLRIWWLRLLPARLEYQWRRLRDCAGLGVHYSGSTDHHDYNFDYYFIHFDNNHNTRAKYDNDISDIHFIYINPS